MNYDDWMKVFGNRTPEQLTGIVNAIDILEKDENIRYEFDGCGLFDGFSIRSAAREALKIKEEQRIKGAAEVIYITSIAWIAEDYPDMNPAMITRPETLEKIIEWIRDIKTNDSTLDTAGAIIDTVIDDVHVAYQELKSKYIGEAGLAPGADESECSILYGDAYYSLEDNIQGMLVTAFNGGNPAYPENNSIMTTAHFWDCECDTNYIHPRTVDTCAMCNVSQDDKPDSRIDDVVIAKLKGEI